MESTDHYSVLGIPQFSSMQDIKQAYRCLALQHHPDKTQGTDSSDFILATNSYKYLCQNKSIYDILLNQSSITDLPEKLLPVDDFDVDDSTVSFECQQCMSSIEITF